MINALQANALPSSRVKLIENASKTLSNGMHDVEQSFKLHSISSSTLSATVN